LLDASIGQAYQAWLTAPKFFGFHIIFDLPALFIIVFITWLVYRGIKESRNASNLMVVVKLAIILLVIGVGIFYIDTENWNPFAPNGIGGILKGVSAVFFAYIGFDANGFGAFSFPDGTTKNLDEYESRWLIA
jgi:amino acid transporter